MINNNGYKVGDAVGTLKDDMDGYREWGWYGVSAEAWAPNMIANKYRPCRTIR